MIGEGGAVVLLAMIVFFLMKKLPVIADHIVDGHTKAINDMTSTQAKTVETFAADAREARRNYREEQEAARAMWAGAIREERQACEARSARIEARMDTHAQELQTIGLALQRLLDRRDNDKKE